jgi:hypothetical protein
LGKVQAQLSGKGEQRRGIAQLRGALVGEVTPGQVVVSATGLREGLLVQSAQQFST